MPLTPNYEAFKLFATLRHNIWHARQRGEPKPWTDDAALQRYSFTNVFRELDKTTVWYAKNVRERFNATPHVFMATVLFRWFNRIETGEVIFNQIDAMFQTDVGHSYLSGEARKEDLQRSIKAALGKGPYTTGAYIITSPAGMDKLRGVIECVDLINTKRAYWIDYFTGKQRTLQEAWSRLKEEKHMGPFMAYEVITDLYHTHLLEDAPDIMTWCNPGPGAKRGLLRLYKGDSAVTDRGVSIPWNSKECIRMIRDLMTDINRDESYDPAFWGKPYWDMRDVEHTLCEFDKFRRVHTGLGTPRGRYNGLG